MSDTKILSGNIQNLSTFTDKERLEEIARNLNRALSAHFDRQTNRRKLVASIVRDVWGDTSADARSAAMRESLVISAIDACRGAVDDGLFQIFVADTVRAFVGKAPHLPEMLEDAVPPTDDTLAYVRHCATCWEPGACLVGNARAGDIIRAIDAIWAERNRLRDAINEAEIRENRGGL